jgi:hypothetical protein
MDKSLENMDKRFKSIENELNYKYDSELWNSVESMLENTALDSAFIKAANLAAYSPSGNFNDIDDAFLDDSFVDATKDVNANYDPKFYEDFKSQESNLYQNDSYTNAASLSSAIYQKEYWDDADVALQKEGLHHEYKTDYWKEAEKLLLKEERKGFFYKWGAVATLLLLFSMLGFNFINLTVNPKVISNSDQNTILKNNILLNESTLDIIDHESSTLNNGLHELNETAVYKDENNGFNDEKYILKNNEESSKGTIKDVEPIPNSIIDDLALEYDEFKLEKITHDDVSKYKRDTKFYIEEEVLRQNIISEISFTAVNIEPIHKFGVKLSKGIGTSFNKENISTLSPRNSVFVDYRINNIRKYSNIQFGVDLGLYHMNLDNYEYERNYSIHHIEGEVEHFWYKMTFKDLVFISVNLNTYVNLSQKNKIRIGVGFDNLLTSRIGIEYKGALDENTIDTGAEWGVNRGINKLDFNLGLGYEFLLNDKFSFIIDSKIGAIDKTNNEYLHVEKMDRDLSVQLGLKYNIFTSK